MSNMLNDTLENAKGITESAKEGAQQAATSARSTFLDGIHAFTGIVSMLRGLGVNDALGWVGLARRRSPISMIAMFGAGVAVGAGVGMVFAPQSGAELRRTIRARFWGLERSAKRGIEEVGAAAKQYEQKAEDAADKAKETVKDTAQDLAGKAKETAQDLVGKAKDVVKDVEKKAESMTGQQGTSSYDTKSTYGGENGRVRPAGPNRIG